LGTLELVDAPGHVAKRDETLAVSLLPKGNGRERERRNSEEDPEHEGMNLGNLFRGTVERYLPSGAWKQAPARSATNPMSRESSSI
jgi:hypothetical protein